MREESNTPSVRIFENHFVAFMFGLLVGSMVGIFGLAAIYAVIT